MIPSFIEIENILKTLPVGYYIGRNVPLALTNKKSSYYVPMDDKAFISYPMLKKVMEKVESKLNDENIENITRTLTYHEISHAFITPKLLVINDVINVFEDERIESICRNYYKGVNFKELLMLMNDWDGKTEPIHDTPFSVWYSLVRYHLGKPRFLIKVANLLKKYQSLHRFSDYYLCRDYKNEVMALYKEVEEDFYKDELKKEKEAEERTNAAEEKPQNNNTDMDMSASNDDDVKKSDEMDEAEPENVSQSEEKLSSEELREKRPNEMSDEFFQELFENITRMADEDVKTLFKSSQVYVNSEIQERLTNIVLAHKKVAKSNAAAINAYSGVFNPMSVVREDYKWFVQQNRQGNVKQFSKIKLNLFIDVSGSFRRNERIVNQILFALSKLEQSDPNFKFDLITMGTEFELKSRNEREIKCYGGNNIPDYANDIIKRVQNKQCMNYNIVLFDGDALSDNYSKDKGKQFEFFNIRNTVMILDYSNFKYANKYCKNVKQIYTIRYTEELIDQICVALNFLFK